MCRKLHPLPQAEIAAGRRVRLPESGRCTVEQHAPAFSPCPRTEIHSPVRGCGGHPVVFHVNHGTGQLAERRHQARHIGRMLPDCRFVQHVQHILQPAGQRHRQPHPLRLAARQRGRRPVQRDIAKPHRIQRVQAPHNLRLQPRHRRRNLDAREKRPYIRHGQRQQVWQPEAAPPHRCGSRMHARIAAPFAALAFTMRARTVEMHRRYIAEPGSARRAHRRPGQRLRPILRANSHRIRTQAPGLLNGLPDVPHGRTTAQVAHRHLDIVRRLHIQIARVPESPIHPQRVRPKGIREQSEQRAMTPANTVQQRRKDGHIPSQGQRNQPLHDLILRQHGQPGAALGTMPFAEVRVQQS